MNIHAQAFVWTHVFLSLGYLPRNRTVGLFPKFLRIVLLFGSIAHLIFLSLLLNKYPEVFMRLLISGSHNKPQHFNVITFSTFTSHSHNSLMWGPLVDSQLLCVVSLCPRILVFCGSHPFCLKLKKRVRGRGESTSASKNHYSGFFHWRELVP